MEEKTRAKQYSDKIRRSFSKDNVHSWLSLSSWKLETEPSSFASRTGWSNKDMDVTPPQHRTWTVFSYLYLWASDGLNVGTMQQASSIVALGLSWREALPAIAVGNLIVATALVANGTIGARFHIPFPIISRASFGFYFSYFAVASRLALALIYFGINSFIGSSCIHIMIKSIWPSFENLQNSLPTSSGLTTTKMISYLVFWAVQFPFVLVPPRKMQWIFLAKSIIVTVAAFALLGWAVHTGGSGDVLAAKSTLQGSKRSWAWVYGLNIAISGKTTLAINMPDLSRYARRTSDQYYQLLIIPFIYTLFSAIGVIIASSSGVIYEEVLWDPTQIIARWGNRAAAFFCATAFCFAQLGTNISTNSIAATNDFTFIFPRYLNIKRSAFITAFLGGWATCPWKIQESGQALTTFLSGYVVVLSPILAIMLQCGLTMVLSFGSTRTEQIVDFWIVRKQRIDVPQLYKNEAIYRYNGGFNWRAVVTLICIVPINLPGLAQKINSNLEIGNMEYVYMFSWLNSFIGASFVYTLISFIFPPRSTFLERSVYDDDQIEKLEYPDDAKVDSLS